ncbi:hypothetical protein EGW08_002897, partial [Elysia chlorotica]
QDLSWKQKWRQASLLAMKTAFLLLLLWVFVCSLDCLSSAFRLLGGKAAGKALSSSVFLTNPVAGVMVGVLVTLLLQSSSTTTSILVSMVSSDVITLSSAIPIVMGSNIGTTVTNTLVALGHVNVKGEFRRAFAAATLHDFFNWLCVLVLLPVEVVTGYLYHLTDVFTSHLNFNQSDTSIVNPKLFRAITEPVTNRIIYVTSLWCKIGPHTHTIANNILICLFDLEKRITGEICLGERDEINEVVARWEVCSPDGAKNVRAHLFSSWAGSDTSAGVLLLAASIATLSASLLLLVRLLSSLLKGAVATAIQRGINSECPGPCRDLTGYAAMLVGAALTVLVQSSSVLTSALTPLVGLGAVNLERVYPVVLGANLGTTVTGMLAALASDPASMRAGLRLALSHLLFNLSGVMLWYPWPPSRQLPLSAAKATGNTVARCAL